MTGIDLPLIFPPAGTPLPQQPAERPQPCPPRLRPTFSAGASGATGARARLRRALPPLTTPMKHALCAAALFGEGATSQRWLIKYRGGFGPRGAGAVCSDATALALVRRELCTLTGRCHGKRLRLTSRGVFFAVELLAARAAGAFKLPIDEATDGSR